MNILRNINVYGAMIALLLAGCQNHQPVWITKSQNQSSATIDWENFFTAQPKIDSFIILNTGSVKVPLSGMLNTKKLPANHGLDNYLWVDVYAFLFHHETRGWYLIDSGLDSTFQTNGNISGLLSSNYIKETKQEKQQNIGAQLLRENKEIEGIFFTHLHGDHTAGLPEISSAIPKFAGEGEEFTYIPLLYHSNHLTAQDTLTQLNWDAAINLHPFNKVLDIFDDGSLLAIHTPGHSAGHTSYLLHTSQGTILLTGDASHTQYGFKKNIEPGWVDDEQLAVNSLNQLRAFAEMFPKVSVIYGHQK